MSVIINALKQKLAPFGWVETVRRDAKAYSMSAVSRVLGDSDVGAARRCDHQTQRSAP